MKFSVPFVSFLHSFIHELIPYITNHNNQPQPTTNQPQHSNISQQHNNNTLTHTRYGNIEDILVHVRLVTTEGTLEKSVAVPRLSAGPDLHHIVLGSEGAFGIVTEAIMRVRPKAPVTRYARIHARPKQSEATCFAVWGRERGRTRAGARARARGKARTGESCDIERAPLSARIPVFVSTICFCVKSSSPCRLLFRSPITSVAMSIVSRMPGRYGSLIFPNFECGLNCMHEVAVKRIAPVSIRLVDNVQFQFGQALKPGPLVRPSVPQSVRCGAK